VALAAENRWRDGDRLHSGYQYAEPHSRHWPDDLLLGWLATGKLSNRKPKDIRAADTPKKPPLSAPAMPYAHNQDTFDATLRLAICFANIDGDSGSPARASASIQLPRWAAPCAQ